jgi:hypothetical protein
MIERSLPPAGDADGDAAAAAAAASNGAAWFCPLASVRPLQISVRSAAVFTPTNIARLVRAAPQLETLIIFASEVDADATWLAHPAFGKLVRLKLKRIRVSGLGSTTLLKSEVVSKTPPSGQVSRKQNEFRSHQ